jgi:hypothetical protein
MAEPLQPYGPLRELAPGLWCVDGEWYDTPFKRRMTIVRLKSGELVVHSAIRMKDEDYAALDKLGQVAWIVAPNAFHTSEAHAYADRYPSARVLVPAAAEKAMRKQGRVDGVLPEGWPAALRGELDVLELAGLRYVNESVFFHRPTRTLLAVDLVFNLQDEYPGMLGRILRWNQIDRRFGPSRAFRWIFTRDKAALAPSIRKMLEWDIDRVVMSHGRVLDTGGRQALEAGFTYLPR